MALTQQVSHWLATFESALAVKDYACALSLFDNGCFWRDIVAFTWNIKTLEGKEEISSMMRERLDDVHPTLFRISGEASFQSGTIDALFTFETRVGRGKGHLRLKGEKCWTFLTSMQELKGHEERRGDTRPMGVDLGSNPNRLSWLELRQKEEAELGYQRQPYVVIIGGGQGGIALAARLRALRVPTIVIEKNTRAGDSWRGRYRSLCLHDPVWYDHLPYLPFPTHWPVYAPKDQIADWLEMYVKIMEVNFWTSSECTGCKWEEQTNEWSVNVTRNGSEKITLKPKQLVIACGMAGIPRTPIVPGADSFKGVQHHSSRHSGGEAFRGKKCIVIGSNNSAHDIAADLWEHGAEVTMIQRSSTMIARLGTLQNQMGALYSEQAVRSGLTTDVADLVFASIPYRVLPTIHRPGVDALKVIDADLYEGLKKVGFMTDFGDDESGLFMKFLRRGSGYYIDVGASALVMNGSIKLKSQTHVTRVNEHSVILADGSELPADILIYATGFSNMNGWVRKLISEDIASKVGSCWGLGSNTTMDPGPWEGELRNMWKPTPQNGLWFMGGNLAQSRFYSLPLALQLKARLESVNTPVYALSVAHHNN